jgi:signal transduction histidine kinase
MASHVLLFDLADEVARLQYHLLKSGDDFTVVVATDPAQAAAIAARVVPDIVVCDPDLDPAGGAQFVRRLRAATPGTRVVAWTHQDHPEMIAEVLAEGACGYLSKDETAPEVERAVRAVIAGHVVVGSGIAETLGLRLTTAVEEARGAREELERNRSQVSSGSAAKADFLANISHELRTPVTVAKGIAHVLRNPSIGEEERAEFTTQLQNSLDKLMGIVDEVITMAELERGTFELHLARLDLAPLLRDAIDDLRVQYPEVPIDVSMTGDLAANADAPRISSVMRELLDNACRYSPAGAAVEVLARSLDEGVVVTVTDHGEGLHRAVAAQSFEEPFTTGEDVLRKERSGVGIGLHLARQLVVEHGGILWTDPLPGGGTRASFCLPAGAEALTAPPI